MTEALYQIIGGWVGVVTLIVGVLWAAFHANDAGDLLVDFLVAFAVALGVGAVWVVAVPLILIWAAIVGVGKWAAARARKRERAEWERLHVRRESDGDKFRRMAREQRDLARQARKDGMPDLADMQDGLADQYEQTARIYDRETA